MTEEDDWIRIVSTEELNQMADVINNMVKERGGTDYCGYVIEPSQYAVFGNHVIKSISEEIEAGIIPKRGSVMWY